MILNHCRLIPELSDGISTEDGAVIVENGAIADVSSTAVTTANDNPVIDCGGKTLLPGLIDAHTHISTLRNYDSAELKDPMCYFTKTCLHTKRYLDYGFTTIRDCGTPLRVANHVRDAYEKNLCIGPRVIACGLILSPLEIEQQDSIYEIYAWTDGVDAAIRATRREIAEHADFVKVMASGSALHRHGLPVQPIILEEELKAMTRVAAIKGSYVAAHAHGDGAIRLCVDSGVRTIEHASYISEATIEALIKTENCYIVPTLSAFYQNPETTAPEFAFLVEKLNRMKDITAGCISHAYRAGIKMGFGTDSTCGMDQYEHGLEFMFRKELCGMDNVDILLQATKNNAEILNIASETGEIKKGLSADMILVDGAPDQDISIMTRRPAAVFLRGQSVNINNK